MRYSSLFRRTRASRTSSTMYSSSSLTIIGGDGGFRCPERGSSAVGLRRETCCTGCILMSRGKSSLYAQSKTTFKILNDSIRRWFSFRLGRSVVTFFALSHTSSPSLKVGADVRCSSACSRWRACAWAISTFRWSWISAKRVATARASNSSLRWAFFSWKGSHCQRES